MFNFEKIHEEELRLATEDCQALVGKIRKEIGENWDPKDPEYTSLYEAFLDVMRKQNISQQESDFNNETQRELNKKYEEILKRITELNRKNNLLTDKYRGNHKAARVDKRLVSFDNNISPMERYAILSGAVDSLDEQILHNSGILDSESYFMGQVMKAVLDSFDKAETTISYPALNYASTQIFDEYIKEYKGEE